MYTSYIETMQSIKPSSVIEYLSGNGWQEERKIDSRAAIWVQIKDNKKFSVLLPLDTEIPDYFDRMYEVFKTIELFEQRPLSDIVHEMNYTKFPCLKKIKR